MSPSPDPTRSDPEFLPSGFFAFRTPLLPFAELLAWSEGLEADAALHDRDLLEQALAADRARLRDRLRALIERPLIRDAIFIASPDLDESLEAWRHNPDSDRGSRTEWALVRYFARMAGRPTPFGLFAGSSAGAIGDRTRLLIEGRDRYTSHSRLDMDYLFALAEAVARDPSLRKSFDLRPNSSLYRAAGRVHYVEARLNGKDRTHHLVAVEDSDDLQATLARAAEGASAEALAFALVNDEVTATEAEAYVGELIDSQILRPDVALFVTGHDPADALAHQLRDRPETASIGDRLDHVREALSTIDAAGPGRDPATYRAVAKQLEGLPAPVELSRLFQVDMVKLSPEARLGEAVLDEIVHGVDMLRRLVSATRTDDLSRFRDAFVARYEGREVALVEALDEEAGLGFPAVSGGDAGRSPLLEGIDLPGGPDEAASVSWGPRENFLVRKLTEALARGATEIVLDSRDLEQLDRKDPPQLPGAFAVIASVAAASEEALSRGDFRLLWMGTDGPSGARLLGRFCHADPSLRRSVEQHLRAEEALDPEAVFAEVVHLPEGRLGNILFRPVLRDYEIVYLGCSGAPRDRQIPITDLLVSVSGGRLVLRSARLGRRVVARLTSAHNFHRRSLGVYRFLCELQAQGTAGSMGWDWGPLRSAPFLPRVVCGRLVLSLAQWTVGREELKRLGASRGTDRFRTVQSWRAERRLPRQFLLADDDNRLPVDLANVLSVESFVHLVKDRDEATLLELFPGPDELCARGPEGRFVHELMVPFERTSSAEVDPVVDSPKEEQRPVQASIHRSFMPGSQWIYAKIYTGASTADRVLRETVGPLVQAARDSGAADRWFFIRYGDPDWHLRLRLHGVPARLHGEVLPALHAAAGPLLADGRLWKVQLDTYEREVERYGGPEAIELAEHIFQADSEAVLEILGMLEQGDAGADERWRLAILGIDALLGDFGFDLDVKRALLEQVRREFGKELRADEHVTRGLADRLRKESKSLEILLDPERNAESSLSPGVEVLRSRSDRLAPLIRALKDRERTGRLVQPLAAIAPSYIHMHVNRLLDSSHRKQELVLYDFLARLYGSRTIRRRRPAASS